MNKLYKLDNTNKLEYAEYWIDQVANKVIIHTGKVGYNGKTEELDFSDFNHEKSQVNHLFMEKYLNKGYQTLPEDRLCWVVVQYPMKSLQGNKRDHWLKDKVSEYLNNELGWKGLGHIDGWDMGIARTNSNKFVLNIYCIVVDEEKAIRTIKNCLKEYRLDYTQIKIASRPNIEQCSYQFKYSAKKNEQSIDI